MVKYAIETWHCFVTKKFRTVDPHPPTVPNRKLGAFPKVDLLLISSIVLKFVFNLRCCEDEDDEVEEDGDEVKLQEDGDGDELQEDGDEEEKDCTTENGSCSSFQWHFSHVVSFL